MKNKISSVDIEKFKSLNRSMDLIKNFDIDSQEEFVDCLYSDLIEFLSVDNIKDAENEELTKLYESFEYLRKVISDYEKHLEIESNKILEKYNKK